MLKFFKDLFRTSHAVQASVGWSPTMYKIRSGIRAMRAVSSGTLLLEKCAFLKITITLWRNGLCVCTCRHVTHGSPCVCSFLIPGERGAQAGQRAHGAPLGPVPLEFGFVSFCHIPAVLTFRLAELWCCLPHTVRLRGRCLLFWVPPPLYLGSQLLEVWKLL